MGRIHSR